MPLVRDHVSEAKGRRLEIEEGLRRQGVLTESLIQWFTTMDMMLADALERLEVLERIAKAAETGGEK